MRTVHILGSRDLARWTHTGARPSDFNLHLHDVEHTENIFAIGNFIGGPIIWERRWRRRYACGNYIKD